MLKPLDIFSRESMDWMHFPSGPADRIDWQIFQHITQQAYKQAPLYGRGTKTIIIAHEVREPILVRLKAQAQEDYKRKQGRRLLL